MMRAASRCLFASLTHCKSVPKCRRGNAIFGLGNPLMQIENRRLTTRGSANNNEEDEEVTINVRVRKSDLQRLADAVDKARLSEECSSLEGSTADLDLAMFVRQHILSQQQQQQRQQQQWTSSRNFNNASTAKQQPKQQQLLLLQQQQQLLNNQRSTTTTTTTTTPTGGAEQNKSTKLVLRPILPFIHELMARTLVDGDVAIDATVGNGFDTLWLAKCVGPRGTVFGFDVQQEALDKARQRLINEQESPTTTSSSSQQQQQQHDASTAAAAATATATNNASRLEDRVTLFLADHSRMKQYIPQEKQRGAIKFVVFNLGYLPNAASKSKYRNRGTNSNSNNSNSSEINNKDNNNNNNVVITTTAETTIPALEAAFEMLAPGGVIAVGVYVGHPEGRTEAQAVFAWAEALANPQHKQQQQQQTTTTTSTAAAAAAADAAIKPQHHEAHVLLYRFLGRDDAPSLLLIEKLQRSRPRSGSAASNNNNNNNNGKKKDK